MNRVRSLIGLYAGDERGATAVEYGIMVALIAVVIIVTVAFLGQALNDAFGAVQICVGTAWTGNPVCS